MSGLLAHVGPGRHGLLDARAVDAQAELQKMLRERGIFFGALIFGHNDAETSPRSRRNWRAARTTPVRPSPPL